MILFPHTQDQPSSTEGTVMPDAWAHQVYFTLYSELKASTYTMASVYLLQLSQSVGFM